MPQAVHRDGWHRHGTEIDVAQGPFSVAIINRDARPVARPYSDVALQSLIPRGAFPMFEGSMAYPYHGLHLGASEGYHQRQSSTDSPRH